MGFTLPYDKETIADEGVHARCADELRALAARLAAGVNTRLQEEHDTQRRRRLAALPEEFLVLTRPLGELIDRVFADSRYDDTQHHATLRGVYFTSAAQTGGEAAAETRTVARRLAAATGRAPAAAARAAQQETSQSFFLHDLLTKIVIPDARLVQPNLRWEYRSRTLSLAAHALALLLFAWVAIGLRVSMGNNDAYLDALARKTAALASRVDQLYKAPKPEAVPDVLTQARSLSAYPGLDLSAPGSGWRFGLYTPPGIVAESSRTYDALEDTLLLPRIVTRIEAVLSQAIADRDPSRVRRAARLPDAVRPGPLRCRAGRGVGARRLGANRQRGGLRRPRVDDRARRATVPRRAHRAIPLIRNDALIRQARVPGRQQRDRAALRAREGGDG